MWKRMSEAEIVAFDVEDAVRRRRIRTPLLIATGMSIGVGVLWSAGYRGSLRSGVVAMDGERPLSDPSTLFAMAFTFVFMFVIAYRHQRRTGRTLSQGSGSVICERCQQLSDPGRSSTCPCGGHLETIDHWEWVDDEGADKPQG